MSEKLLGYNFPQKPRYVWPCMKCKYLFTVEAVFKNHIDYTDVYESCTIGYIFVNSEEPGDYHSSVTMKLLAATYVAKMKNFKT